MNGMPELMVTQAQGFSLMPEAFQENLITHMTTKLSLQEPPPCLLRAPTGSGKTFVLCKVLGNVSASTPTLWLWFVPFVNLVNQTLDALVTNATDLAPFLFGNGINQEPAAGQVLISTTQGVSRAAWRRADYNTGGGETVRTPAEFVALARANGLSIGVVVDEAHIALDQATEFGQFVNWLNPRYLAMATATPKSDRITQFLDSAGMADFESFNVSRDDVVKARLNKAFVEAVIYDLRESTVAVADLKRTVLRQAWLRNQQIKRELAAHGIAVNPLLLVQVENGKGSIEDAERDLIDLCGVSPHAIGKHSADAPDPDLMAAIANDESKEVLIFKQSAGTGFDAPRAFVLASTKAVNDPDFAMQFIGRVMRVHRQIRGLYLAHDAIPPSLNTAYIYLANAEAQQGFQQAVQITDSIQTQLEGQVERMVRRTTRSGATLITNAPSNQPSLSPRWSPDQSPADDHASSASSPEPGCFAPAARNESAPDTRQPSLFDAADLSSLDTAAPHVDSRPNPTTAQTRQQWLDMLKARGINAYPLRVDLPKVPRCLKREERPTILNLDDIVRRVATRLTLQDRHLREALLAVRGRLQEIERHTELTKRVVSDAKVSIVVDRNRIMAEAKAVMRQLPQIEDADHRTLIDVLSGRVLPRLREQLEDAGANTPESEVVRMARTAACWLIRTHAGDLEEALFEEIAAQAVTLDAAQLPDVYLYPTDVALPASSKNLYGVLPPGKEDLLALEQLLLQEDRRLLDERSWTLADGDTLHVGRFDGTFALNPDEQRFAQALDRASFVAWWFRNPDKKPYSVRLVRGEHRNYFYPDFVVCLAHVDGVEPVPRLIETKHDLKDARRKSRHAPEQYGQVLFLTMDGGKLHVVTQDGGIGEVLDLGDLEALREALQKTAP